MIDILNEYKNNNLKKNHLTYYQAFDNIYAINKNATDNVVMTITEAAYDVYLHDEEGYSITKYTNFLATNYYDKKITLKEIENASKWDIMEDAELDTLFNFEQLRKRMRKNKEMER